MCVWSENKQTCDALAVNWVWVAKWYVIGTEGNSQSAIIITIITDTIPPE